MEEKLTYYQKNKEKYKEQQRQKIQKKYDGLKEDYDFVVCKICGYKCADLGTHLKSHGINSKEYKEKYGQDSQIKCQKMRDRVRGENNPGFNHGGKLSPFSDKFIHAKDGYKEEVVKKATKSRKDNNSNTTTLEYWLKKTNDIEEAEKMLANRQKTFSLDICIKKYGDERGYSKWLSRQEKWLKSFNNKTQEEIEEINRKKSNLMSYSILWRNEANYDGKFYILDIGNGYYKIGITTQTIEKRYSKYKDKYSIVKVLDMKINECFQIEQLIKKHYKNYSITKEDMIEGFGWTETFIFNDIISVLEYVNNMTQNKSKLLRIFKEEFNLKYAEKFI